MINYTRGRYGSLLDRLKQEGVKIDPNEWTECLRSSLPGSMTWTENKIELWQPLPPQNP